jgi:hypothetical protein
LPIAALFVFLKYKSSDEYTLYLIIITFLVFPALSNPIAQMVRPKILFWLGKVALILFLPYDVLFLLGFSFRGDHIDACIFSFEYMIFCTATWYSFNAQNLCSKILRIAGTIVISFFFLIGFLGIWLFAYASQEYEPDKIFHLTSDGKSYETRRYSFGGVLSSDTRYTFDTYRYYRYLPIERKIDETDFFDEQTELDIGEDSLQISIQKDVNNRTLLFKSTNRHNFIKLLD